MKRFLSSTPTSAADPDPRACRGRVAFGKVWGVRVGSVVVMSSGLRHEEEWAQRVMSSALGCRVEQHDDNSKQSMFDLRVGSAEAPERVIEVVSAVDEERMKTLNTVCPEPIEMTGVTGGWTVEIKPEARMVDLCKQLPEVLQSLQDSGLTFVPVDHLMRRDHRGIYDQLVSLKVNCVSGCGAVGSGKVRFMMEGLGGRIDSTGSAISEWVGRWLGEPERKDVLRKLGDTEAPVRDVFIVVRTAGLNWGVVDSYLSGISSVGFKVPSGEPHLPEPVTGVWIASQIAFGDPLGIWWNREKWATMRVAGPDIDSEVASSRG